MSTGSSGTMTSSGFSSSPTKMPSCFPSVSQKAVHNVLLCQQLSLPAKLVGEENPNWEFSIALHFVKGANALYSLVFNSPGGANVLNTSSPIVIQLLSTAEGSNKRAVYWDFLANGKDFTAAVHSLVPDVSLSLSLSLKSPRNVT